MFQNEAQSASAHLQPYRSEGLHASQAANPQPDTQANQLANGCELLAREMNSLENRIAQMLTRLCGPIPVGGDAGMPADKAAPSGLLGTIETRLIVTASSVKRAHDLMTRLEKIV